MTIQAIPSLHLLESPIKPEASTKVPISFSDWVMKSLEETNDKLLASDRVLNELAMGKSNNLHQSMIVLEETKLSFQFLEQVRNRIMSAYQELLREQI